MCRTRKVRLHNPDSRSLKLFAFMMFVFLFTGCYDTTDQMVHATEPIEHFTVEELRSGGASLKENVISVEGIVKDINFLNNRMTIVLSSVRPGDASVLCDMQRDQKTMLQGIDLGEKVTVKGIYKGALKDVIILNCIIYNQPSND